MEMKETYLCIVDSHQLSGSGQASNLGTFQKRRYCSVIRTESFLWLAYFWNKPNQRGVFVQSVIMGINGLEAVGGLQWQVVSHQH